MLFRSVNLIKNFENTYELKDYLAKHSIPAEDVKDTGEWYTINTNGIYARFGDRLEADYSHTVRKYGMSAIFDMDL